MEICSFDLLALLSSDILYLESVSSVILSNDSDLSVSGFKLYDDVLRLFIINKIEKLLIKLITNLEYIYKRYYYVAYY